MPARQMITIAEAAQTYGVHPNTIRRHVAAGRLPAVRVGPRLLRVDAADVEALAQPVPTVGRRRLVS